MMAPDARHIHGEPLGVGDLTVVLGVTGGIAAYKACELVSLLRKNNAAVHVIMTEAATHFVAPLTFRELSGNPVVVDMFAEPARWNMQHVTLARAADVFAVVPATANVIAKLAHGFADNMLTTTALATTAPIIVAPAMNHTMYLNPLVQENLTKLRALGVHVVDPEEGHLACGETGPGRLADVEHICAEILAAARRYSNRRNGSNGEGEEGPRGTDLAGVRVLVTAGPTREPIDPVRFLSNRSSGKMGFAIAEAAASRGAEVVLISGPTAVPAPRHPLITLVPVETAEQMYQEALLAAPGCQVVVAAAAVADFRPERYSPLKVKKTSFDGVLRLTPNPDILAALGSRKSPGQVVVGFAAETGDESLLPEAREKLVRKNLDLIVANDITHPEAGFGRDTNVVVFLTRANPDVADRLGPVSKREVAEALWDRITALLPPRESRPHVS